jgi:dihydrofolate reductase
VRRVVRSLLSVGLVDEVQVAVVPVLLGGGKPLPEPPAARSTLRLAKHTLYSRTGTRPAGL